MYYEDVKKKKATCEICNAEFTIVNRGQKVCGKTCGDIKKIIDANNKWMNRKTERRKPKVSERFQYGYIYDENSFFHSKRLRHCRG